MTSFELDVLSFVTSRAIAVLGEPLYTAVAVFLARDAIGILAVLSVLAIILWAPRDARLRVLRSLVLTVILAYGLSEVVKAIGDRPRPFAVGGFLPLIPKDASDPSFPSGHATVAFAFVFPLLAFIPRWARAVLIAAAILIAVGRVAVGVHYPSDVIAGAVFAFVVWTFIRAAVRTLDSNTKRPHSEHPSGSEDARSVC